MGGKTLGVFWALPQDIRRSLERTKCRNQASVGAVPILLLAISASTTGTYSSLNVLQESNPQPQLLKALVYHSATSAVGVQGVYGPQSAPLFQQ
jgi:hypothetical protein